MRRLSITASGLLMAAILAGCEAPADGDGDGGGGGGEVTGPLPAFAKSFDGPIVVRSAAMGQDGDVFFGGDSTALLDFGGGELQAVPEGSLFVAHLAANGDHLFSGITGVADELRDVAIGPGGELHVTGTFSGDISFGSGMLSGEDDGFFATFTRDGTPARSFAAGSDGDDGFTSVVTTPLGLVVLAGRFGRDADLGGGAVFDDFSGPVPTIVAYDEEGGHLWQLHFASWSNVRNLTLASDGAGNILVAGEAKSDISVGGLEDTAGAFVMKLDAAGEPMWLRSTGSNDDMRLTGMATDAAGHVVFGGLYTGSFTFGGFVAPATSSTNGYLAGLDANGKPLFLRAFGRSDDKVSLEMATSRDGTSVVAITTDSPVDLGEGLVGADDGDSQVVVGRFDAGGGLIGAEVLAGTGEEYAYSVVMGPDGAPVLLGAFDGELTVGGADLVADPQAGISTFVARLAP